MLVSADPLHKLLTATIRPYESSRAVGSSIPASLSINLCGALSSEFIVRPPLLMGTPAHSSFLCSFKAPIDYRWSNFSRNRSCDGELRYIREIPLDIRLFTSVYMRGVRLKEMHNIQIPQSLTATTYSNVP